MARTRLDRLVKVRERSEGRAREELARARGGVARAADRLEATRAGARADGRGAGAAGLWAVEEIAHARALRSVDAAEAEVAQALRRERVAQAGLAAARNEAEAARRARERKLAEQRAEDDRKERRALDELATLAFNRRA
ncbi:flagellar FliJ family protein [Anaeromyxobacter dehalogenans]|uniref:Flagellar FliJ protein n=1 Tax=Anaeromyxobacter dehalogenans (strain 2CP-C) TaxID=290397 RepID=Q2IQP4_ANADE|nr:flagellar FliJ family protein [Anaeromyxobacter dehalogenans]ABC81127.1 conserved hypothetical protein [Anaeromyxobacter dehalogenans 2CP-C]